MVNRETEYNRAKINAERSLKNAQEFPTEENWQKADGDAKDAAEKKDAYLRLCPGTYWPKSSQRRNKQRG